MTSPLLFAVVQTVAKPSVKQPYVAPRKKAGTERQSETLEEKSSDMETSDAEQVRDFRVPRLSLRLSIIWLVTSCPIFDMGLHLWLTPAWLQQFCINMCEGTGVATYCVGVRVEYPSSQQLIPVFGAPQDTIGVPQTKHFTRTKMSPESQVHSVANTVSNSSIQS